MAAGGARKRPAAAAPRAGPKRARPAAAPKPAPVVAAGDETLREWARSIFAAGCAAADPAAAARAALRKRGSRLEVGRGGAVDLARFREIWVVGVGKACVRFAEGVHEVLGGAIAKGFLITKYGHSASHSLPGTFLVREANHPTPDEAGEAATRELLDLVQAADERTLVICLITGGGTALLTAPAAGITLQEYIECNRTLLGCGCPIYEKNAVLKHLGRATGGQLAQAASPAELVTLVISDVVGDPLDVIASGPTVADESTYGACVEVVERYGLRGRLPPSALAALDEGARGERPETPKAGSPLFRRGLVHVAGSNEVSVDACVRRAEELGFHALALSSFVEGEAAEIGVAFAGIARELAKNGRPIPRPAAIVAGGETTVTLPPQPGRGGRNQALALRALVALDGVPGVALLAGGTDGGDGPTDAAGAVVCGGDAAAARRCGLKPLDSLAGADSWTFFNQLEVGREGGRTNVLHLRDGPTGTNVMDLVVLLVVDPPA